MCAALSHDSCTAHLKRDEALQRIRSTNSIMITVGRTPWSMAHMSEKITGSLEAPATTLPSYASS